MENRGCFRDGGVTGSPHGRRTLRLSCNAGASEINETQFRESSHSDLRLCVTFHVKTGLRGYVGLIQNEGASL